MGCECSAVVHAVERREEGLILALMPVFYISNPQITPYDIRLVEHNWSTIVSGDTSDHYVQNGLYLFQELFYDRICNVSKNLRDIVKCSAFPRQMFLLHTISMILKCLNKFTLFSERLPDYISLCHKHGIRGYELGTLGDVVFYTLQESLGERYDVTTEHAWMFAYSKFLRYATPCLIRYDARRRSSLLTSSTFDNSE